MTDPYWYALMCVMTGGILGVIVPYLFKVADNKMKFSYSYFYAMCITMAIAAAGMVPESIDDLSGRMIMMLVMAGAGLQFNANLVTSAIRKGKVSNNTSR